MVTLFYLLCMLASLIASGAVRSPIAPVYLDRARRSDDTDPLQVVVDQLSQQVVQMQAQIQANKNNMDNLQQAVGFTARWKDTGCTECTNFGVGQVIKFDDIVYNAGYGYNAGTGVFTAPVSGTYVFFLQTMRHQEDTYKIMLSIMKNNVLFAMAHAGYSAWENGSTLAVTHLNRGDTIHVENYFGASVPYFPNQFRSLHLANMYQLQETNRP